MRQAVGDVLVILILVLSVWISAVMLRRIHSVVLKATFRRLYRYELALCAVMLTFALDVRFDLPTLLPAPLGLPLRILSTALTVAIALLLLHTVACGLVNTAGPAKYALVLGMALENGEPSEDLLKRLDVARDYLQQYPDALLILSGGNPTPGGATEAAIMRNLLIHRGISTDRLILEERSRTTDENFTCCAKIVDPSKPIVLITSGYHMARALRSAGKAGYSRVLRLPAPSSPLCLGADLMSEAVLRIRELLIALRA